MLDICLLGTSGMVPLPKRWLTSMMARFNGNSLLVDCGEGTQIAIREKGWSFNPIGVICITHFHADHISGLSGLLLTIGNSDRTEPITIIGPKGLNRVVSALRVIAPELPYELKLIELSELNEHIEINGFSIDAFRVSHAVICYGYTISIPRIGKFDAAKANELNIPVRCWNRLQHGESVEYDGTLYEPSMVMGEARKGLKVTYCTDSRPVEAISDAAAGADLFICEGMYGEPDKEAKAKEHKHMTFEEAAGLAKTAQVKQMWLTHFSPSLVRPWEYIDSAKAIFAETEIGKDGKSIELKFED